MDTLHKRNKHLTQNCFGKLISLLSLDGEKRFKSGIHFTGWITYALGNIFGQYRRVGDRCEWIHPQGMAPYKHLHLDVVPNTEQLISPGWGSATPGGSAQIVQWVSGGVVNLGVPVGFGIGNYTTTNNTWGTGTLTTSTVGSTNTIAFPHGVTIKTP